MAGENAEGFTTIELTDLPDDPPRLLHWETAIVTRVLRLGTWVMIAMITQFFVNAADNFMVGRLEGSSATVSQAALALGMPLFWAVGGFFSAVSFGTQALTGRRFAEGDNHRTGRVLTNSLLVATLAGICGAVIGYLTTPVAFDFFATASDQQRVLGTSYTHWRMLGIPSMVITFSYKAFFDGIGNTHIHMWAALTMNVLNIVLNYLLIYGVPSLGIPEMGLDGAGLASTISTYVGLAIMVTVSMMPRYLRTFRLYRVRDFNSRVMGTIIRLLVPSGSATVILMAGFLLFLRFVGQLDAAAGGNTMSAATKAIMDTLALCFMTSIAFGTATATAVSQSLGAGKTNLAARYGWESVRLGVLAMSVVAAFFFAFPEQIISIWAPNDPAVPAAGAASLRLSAFSLPMMVVGLVLSQALYGAGNNTYVMAVEFVLHFGCLVPLTWLLGPKLGFGLEGAWVAVGVYANMLGIAMGVRFLGKSWRRIRL